MLLSGLTISGRAGAQNTTVVETDPYYSNVSLLLHGDGINGSTSFPDNSPTPKTATVIGSVNVDTAIKKYGTGSLEYAAGTSRLQYADHADFNFGSGDFTIELYAYFNNVTTEQVLITKGWSDSPAYAAFLIYMANTGSLRFNASANGSSWGIANDKVIGTMTAGSWKYIAVTRVGTTFRAFIEGVIQPSFTFTSASSLYSSATQELCVGGRVTGTSTMNGYIDDVRLTKGVGRYTNTYTPPVAAFPNS